MNFLKTYFYCITIPPLLPLMIIFMIGILWQTSNISIILTFFIYLLFLIIYFFYKKFSLQSITWTIAYFLIALSGSYLYKRELNNYDTFYQFAYNKPLEIIGSIEDISETTICNKKTTILTLSIYEIHTTEKIKKINKNILFYGSYNNTIVTVGDIVSFCNVFCKKSINEHLNHYQIREQIIAAVFNHTPSDIKIIKRPAWSFKRWVFNQKQKILQSCKQKLSSQSFLFFTSLFLGNRMYVKENMENVNEQFKRWGIFHFLARSGLHLALFIITWYSILQYIPISFNIKQIIILLLSIIYALLSWTSAPFIRSILLFLCNKTCLITKKSYNLLHYLTVICFCFLLYCPLYLFFLDFQLTFGITFILAWFNQLYDQHLYEQSLYKQLNY